MITQPTFITNIQAAYKDTGKQWLAVLPTLISQLETQWDFRISNPLPNLTYSFVALVELNATHEKVVLKIAPQGSNIITEAKWLEAFHQRVPRIFYIDETKQAFLMEYLTPGISLKSWVKKGQDEAATRIIAETILALHHDQPEYSGYTHISELMSALSVLKGHIDAKLIAKAQSLFVDLTLDRSQDVLLHGDLHHDNILSSGDSWKVIDPHGYVGNPIAEVGPMIRNPMDCYPSDKPIQHIIDTRLKILNEMLPYDPKSIQAWAFCMTLLSAAWDVEENQSIQPSKIEKVIAIDNFKP